MWEFGELRDIPQLPGIRGSPAVAQRERCAGWDGTEGREGRWSRSGLRRATQRRVAVTSHSSPASLRKVPTGNKKL